MTAHSRNLVAADAVAREQSKPLIPEHEADADDSRRVGYRCYTLPAASTRSYSLAALFSAYFRAKVYRVGCLAGSPVGPLAKDSAKP